jgi:hypothetical protein
MRNFLGFSEDNDRTNLLYIVNDDKFYNLLYMLLFKLFKNIDLYV